MSIKMPLSPPPLSDLLREMDGLKMVRALSRAEPVYSDKKYRHWNDLIHLDPPDDLTHEEWWFGIKMKRAASYQSVPLHDTFGLQSQFLLTEIITEQLHHIDLGAGGRIGVPDLITNPDTRDQYYISSLMEEAITSSQLEGATTTREVAKDMIRAARPPQDRNERMILNNYHTMQRIGTLKGQPLTKEIIFELHRIVTEGTLENPSATGRFRKADEEIVGRVQEVAGKRGVGMAQVALAWVLGKGWIMPICGLESVERIDQAVEAVQLLLTEEEMRYLEEPHLPKQVAGY